MNRDIQHNAMCPSGGSRAAKKRAKKRLKDQDSNLEDQHHHHHHQQQQQQLAKMKGPNPSHNLVTDSKRVKRIEKGSKPKDIPEKCMHMNQLVDFLKPFTLESSSSNTNLLTHDETTNNTILVEDCDYTQFLFEFLISPSSISSQEFYRHYWEKKPLLISKEDNLAVDEDEEEDDEEKEEDEVNHVNEDVKNGKQDNYTSVLKDPYKTNPTKLLQYQKRFDDIVFKEDIHKALNAPWNGKDIVVSNYNQHDEEEKGDSDDDNFNNEVSNTHTRLYKKVPKSSKEVWSQYDAGCTIRLNNIQTYNDKLYAMLSLLENEFGCRMEAHIELTPGDLTPNQGYPPQYYNTEAFVLQLEGRKHWRVYPPTSILETLPRGEGSISWTQEDLSHRRKPVIDVEIGPGDLLYIPRGYIHQANTLHGGAHSLNLTIQTMRNWAWCDFLDLIIPDALEAATASPSSTLLRQGLPRNFLNYMGVMHEYRDDQDLPEGLKQVAQSLDQAVSSHLNDDHDKEEEITRLKLLQDEFKAEAKKRIMRVCREALDMVTAGCDQMAKRFLSERLPPIMTRQGIKKSKEVTKIRAQSFVRCVRKGIARIVLEDGKAILYHCMDNARECQAKALSPLEFEVDDGPALEQLVTTTAPQWICIQDLNHGTIEDKIEIAQALFDERILELRPA